MRQPGVRIAFMMAFTLGGIGSAAAFDVAEGQSCGGLVCDLGLFGHKTEPKRAETVAPISPATAIPVAAAQPTDARRPVGSNAAHRAQRRAIKTKTQIATSPIATSPIVKTETERTEADKRQIEKPRVAKSEPESAAVLSVKAAVQMDALPPFEATSALAASIPVAGPLVAAPPAAEPVVLANPYVYSRPQPLQFQSVDPSAGMQ